MFTIGIKATGDSHEIDFAALPEASRDFIVAYGLKQLLNDAHVSEKDVDAKRALIDKKLAKLRDGTLGIREAREATDPVYAEAIRMAAKAFKAAKLDMDAAENAERLHNYVSNPDVIKLATAEAARKRAEREARKAALAALPTV